MISLFLCSREQSIQVTVWLFFLWYHDRAAIFLTDGIDVVFGFCFFTVKTFANFVLASIYDKVDLLDIREAHFIALLRTLW